MNILTYRQILELVTKLRANTMREFSFSDYSAILRACEQNKVLARILTSYAPQDFNQLYKTSRAKYAALVTTDVHDPIFSEGRNATKQWLVDQTPDLKAETIEEELQTTYKFQLIENLNILINNGLLRELYPEASNAELKEHQKDFRDFIDIYLFESYQGGAKGSDNLVRGLLWCLDAQDQELQNNRLFVLFSSLNEARMGYEKNLIKYINARHPYSGGRSRNWSCMPGVDERVLDGLLTLRLSLEKSHSKGQSFEDLYLQSLIHSLINKTAYGFVPSAELYSAYLDAIIPAGYKAYVVEQQQYRIVIQEQNAPQQIISETAQKIAEQEYLRLLNIGAALSNSNAIDEHACLNALSSAGQITATNIDYNLIASFFPSETTLVNVKLSFRNVLTRAGFDLDEPLNNDATKISALANAIKETFNKNAEARITNILETILSDPQEAQARLDILKNNSFALETLTKNILVIKNYQNQEIDIDELISLNIFNDKNMLQKRIETQTGLNKEWLSLLNDLCKTNGTDLWDLCRALLEQNNARFIEHEGELDTNFVRNHLNNLKNNLIELEYQQINKQPNDYFCYYAHTPELIGALLLLIQKNLSNHSVASITEAAPLCDEETLIKCFEFGLWDLLDENEKYKLFIQLVENDYKQILLHKDHINYAELPQPYLLLKQGIKLQKPEMVNKLIQEAHLDLNTVIEDGKTAIMYAASTSSPEIMKMLLTSNNHALDINKQDKDGKTALIHAVIHFQIEIIPLLLEHPKLDVNLQDNQGKTALIYLADQTHGIEISEKLLEREDIDVNKQDKEGKTALMYACTNGLYGTTFLLTSKSTLNINQKDKKGKTALIYAISKSRDSCVRVLLRRQDLNICEKNSDGKTPLMLAVTRRNAKIVEALIGRVGDAINEVDNDGKTAFMMAVSVSDKALGEFIRFAQVLDLNRTDKDGRTALMLAATGSNDKIMSTLLDRFPGLDVNMADKDGRTALMRAITASKENTIIKLLSIDNLNINQQDKVGNNTALILAVSTCQPRIIRELLRTKDINVNQANINGDTALMHAIYGGYTETVATILEEPSLNINAYNIYGDTALMLAIRRGGARDIINLLLNHPNLNVNQKNSQNETALILAVYQRDLALVSTLISLPGTNINEANNNGDTPLILAAYANSILLVDQLLQVPNILINSTNHDGHTALMVAIKAQNLAIIERLLACGADINIQDRAHNTAWSLAQQIGHPVILELMNQHIARLQSEVHQYYQLSTANPVLLSNTPQSSITGVKRKRDNKGV